MTRYATPAELSLSHAAKATGKSKSTINRAIKTGRLSATRHEDGTYSIAAAELFRAFPVATPNGSEWVDTPPPPEPLEILRLKLEILEAERHRERDQMQTTIDDLRARLDRSENRITALLSAPEKTPERRWRFWKKG